jgi:hypothetical protein
MSITINGATNTLTAASGLAIAGNTAVTGTLSATGGISKISSAATVSQFFGASGSTTAPTYGYVSNTGGGLAWGVEGSAPNTVVNNDTAYAGLLYTTTTAPLQFGVNSTVVGTFSSTGLAVTGTLSATGNITSSAGQVITQGATGAFVAFPRDGTGAEFSLYNPTGDALHVYGGSADIATFSSTGLAVTGTLSATGAGYTPGTLLTIKGDEPTRYNAQLGFSVVTGVSHAYLGVRSDNTDYLSVLDIAPTALTLGAGVNLGVGVTPSAWYNGGAVSVGGWLDFGNGDGGASTRMLSNAYAAGVGDYRSRQGAFGSLSYLLDPNAQVFTWSTAPTVAINTAVTFTERMNLSTTALALGTGVGMVVADTTDATSTTAASLKTAGGLAVAKKFYVGDNIVMASGKGIDFSATANGSGTTTSEVLSDYEEGTFTVSATFGGAAVGMDLTSSSGTYTKVGRKVHIQIRFYIQTKGSSTGALVIGGLPFTVSANTAAFAVSAGPAANMLGVPSATATSGTTIAMYQTPIATGLTTAYTDTGMTNGGYFFISGSYQV